MAMTRRFAFQNGSHDADLVQLTEPAILNDYFRTNDGYELRLTSGSTPIRAFLLQSTAPQIAIGSVCRLTRICLLPAQEHSHQDPIVLLDFAVGEPVRVVKEKPLRQTQHSAQGLL